MRAGARLAAVLAAAALVPAALCLQGCGTTPTIKLRLGVFPGEMSAPVAVAGEKGFFRSNGLEATVTRYDSGASAVKALLAGELDVATAADYVFARGCFTGPDLRLLASIGRYDTNWFITKRQSGISKTADLGGRSVGTPQGTVAEYLLGSSLTREGLALHDVRVVYLAPGELQEALRSGSVDAVVVSDPYAYDIKKTLGGEAVSWSAQGGQDVFWTLISRESILKGRPGMSERLMRAMIGAEGFIKEHPDEAKRIVSRLYGLGMPYLDIAWPRNRFEVSLDQALLFTLDMQARWYKESGLAGASALPDYLKLIDFTGLERADPDAVEMVR